MSLEYPNALHAAGAVTGATGAAIWSDGATPARTAKGTYTLTLDVGADAAECGVIATPRGATTAELAVNHTSDTVKTVTAIDNAGAAIDVDFDYLVIRKRNG